MTDAGQRATESLTAHVDGDARAADVLFPLIYEELRALAARYLSGERADHTLQPTALVNEAYVRMIQLDRMDWRGRAHFFAMSARVLRRVLVDHARSHRAQKRGEGVRIESLIEEVDVAERSDVQVLELDVALEKLARVSPRQAEIVELRFFGGLTVEDTAAVLDLGVDRVKADWRFARAWLKRELWREESEP